MRKLTLLLLLTSVVTVPLFAARGRAQSYITYDDGGTVVRQAEDGKEIEGRVNLPVFPGDEVATSRRGRVEIRLSDGNIIALDRTTAVRFRSILDSYDGDSAQTVVDLKYGHVAVQRNRGQDDGRDMLRLDTPSASYAATEQAIYAVEADSNGRDRVTVLDGVIEVRTPARTTRIREGEEAHVDGDGIYGLVSSRASDDFERWFARRADRYGHSTSRYLDRSIAYSEYDLADNGNWVYVNSTDSWCWRPHVSVGWRPYYNGYWRHSPGGLLVWVSYEPWGWTPYHYGRWAYDPGYGWVWAPGAGYAPAWVYWMYGPSYIGWAPMGWYDCYRPYSGWAYRPFLRVGLEIGGGFYGHVRPNDIDLRPWTFVSPGSITTARMDQAALSADAIRSRLLRGGVTPAVVSGAPARFSRNEIKDPAAAVGAIVRRGIGSGTGTGGSGSSAVDMTPFFRRDPELSNAVRDRIVRTRPVDSGVAARTGGSGGSMPALSGVPSPGTPGTLEGRVSRGESRDSGSDNSGGRTIDRGAVDRGSADRGAVDRGTAGGATAPRGGTGGAVVPRGDSTSRDYRIERPNRSTDGGSAGSAGSAEKAPDRTPERQRDETWRGRVVGRTPEASGGDTAPRSSAPAESGSRNGDVPRRIIDRIGGARIYDGSGSTSRDGGSARDGGSSRDGGSTRDSGSSRDSQPRYEPRSTPRESSGSRDSGRVERSSPPPSHDSSSHDSGGSHHDSGGGHVKRDQ